MTAISPQLPGMTVSPAFVNHPAWEDFFKDAWIACIQWAITEKEIRDRFEKETGMSLGAMVRRAPIDQMIDRATGYDQKVMAAFADWATTTLWGLEGSEDDAPSTEAK